MPPTKPEPSQLPAPPTPETQDQPGLPEEPPPADLTGKNAWRHIIIHHSASPSGNAASFDRAHRSKGWDGVAYHFVITNGKGGMDGGLEVSARWWTQKHGAHAGGLPADAPVDTRNDYNEFGIGICLVGNFQQRAPTGAQMKTLARLVTRLRGMFDIPVENVVGHRHVKSTACPGSKFPWRTLFQLTRDSHPQHLYKRPLVATYGRCPWCDVNETLTASTGTSNRSTEPAPVLPPRTGGYVSPR